MGWKETGKELKEEDARNEEWGCGGRRVVSRRRVWRRTRL